MIERGKRTYWVTVYKRKGNEIYYVRVTDTETRRTIGTRSAKTRIKRDAERRADNIARELLEAEFGPETENLDWEEFKRRYAEQVFPKRRRSTGNNLRSTMNRLGEILALQTLDQLKAAKITKFEAALRREGLSEFSVKRHLSNVRTLLNWAYRQEYIERVPHIEMPTEKDLERMKGRAISTEEFERILTKVADVVGADRVADWTYFLRGLWLSGLRLDEAYRLEWDQGDFCLDLKTDRPRFRIAAKGEKGKKNRRHPLTPDFFMLLMETPPERRTGPVFWPSSLIPSRRYTGHTAGQKIQKMGKLAGVVAGKGRGGETHYASAHDFRRSFGTRWSKLVEPEELRRLMRHSSLKVTLGFYVDGVDDDLSESVWAKATEEQLQSLHDCGNNRGNSSVEK